MTLLSSCSTQSDFRILSRSGDVVTACLIRKEHAEPIFCADSARASFISNCKTQALLDFKQAEEIAITDASISRSNISGYTTTEVKGRIRYGKEPFSGVVVTDTSGLMTRANSVQYQRDQTRARVEAITAGLHEANRSMQSQQQINSINNLSRSVDRNTDALNSIRYGY